MSKGGGGGKQVVEQTNLPGYAQPFVEDLFARAETETLRPYDPYQGQRIAGQTAEEQYGGDVIRNMDPTLQGTGYAAQQAMGGINQLQQIGAQGSPYEQFQFGPAGTYTGDAVGQYMSPYMQNVVDVQKQQAQLDFDRAQAGRDANAVQAGAFGGSRGAVVDALAQEDLARQMGAIQAQGQQQAFEQGMGMFEQDRAARMMQEAAQAGEYGRVQEGQMGWNQFGADLAGQRAQMGMMLPELSGMERASQYEYADRLGQLGQRERALEQAYLDQQYQDFLGQRDYGKDQLSWYSDLLRGNTAGVNTTTTQMQQVNPYQQLMGAGLGALGLSQAYG